MKEDSRRAVFVAVPQSYAEGNLTSEPSVAPARNRARNMTLRTSSGPPWRGNGAEAELRPNLHSRKTRAPPRPPL
eukprot:10933578-Prorocentrum_lima.AAC.1